MIIYRIIVNELLIILLRANFNEEMLIHCYVESNLEGVYEKLYDHYSGTTILRFSLIHSYLSETTGFIRAVLIAR